jgi:hypothetical protein
MSTCDEAIQSCFAALWIASRSLSSGAHSRDPLARNDDKNRFRRKANWLSIEGLTLRGLAIAARTASLAANFRRLAANQRQTAACGALKLAKNRAAAGV